MNIKIAATSALIAVLTLISAVSGEHWGCPPPPDPEPIEVIQLPLPPTAPSNATGACDSQVNPRGTGCIDGLVETFSGSFLPDNDHVLSAVNFTGAPAYPNPASIYDGEQLIIIRINGTSFPNGDSWKCITCGIPVSQRVGATPNLKDYPQAFNDGLRVLSGTNIIECESQMASQECTSNNTYIYPIHWTIAANGSGPGGDLRELRLHPDQVHLGFNAFTFTNGAIGENAYSSRLSFNPSPTVGTPPGPRYDLLNVTQFGNVNNPPSWTFDGAEMTFNASAIVNGEWRGWTGKGDEYLTTAFIESDNTDMVAIGLADGKVRRITEYPGYVDPIDVSRDNKWQVILDTRGSNRTDFMDGLRHIPPLNDFVAGGAAASIRNNGDRRFFTPWLLDYCGDRGNYFGQQINGAGDGSPNSINDPNWNARSDPRWSWDGTKIAYHEALVVSPACGGNNPIPCPTPPNGNTYRIMVAKLVSRKPVRYTQAEKIADYIPSGTPFVPGAVAPPAAKPPQGNFTVTGKQSGHIDVELKPNARGTAVGAVCAIYHNYSDNGVDFLSGYEIVEAEQLNITAVHLDWWSNITSTGSLNGSKVTSPDGFHLTIDYNAPSFVANGTLTTTINGRVFAQPANST